MGSLDQQNPSQLHLNILIMQAFIVVLSWPLWLLPTMPQHTDIMPQHTVHKSTAGIPTPLSTLRSACPLSPPKLPPLPWLLRKFKMPITVMTKSELSVPSPSLSTNTNSAHTATAPRPKLSPLKSPK